MYTYIRMYVDTGLFCLLLHVYAQVVSSARTHSRCSASITTPLDEAAATMRIVKETTVYTDSLVCKNVDL